MMSEPIIVLGMHRSGTSFLARALNLCGVWLGGDDSLFTIEGRAFRANAKGNYENCQVIAVNEALLASAGGSWYEPPITVHGRPDLTRQITECVVRLQSSVPAGFQTWGWKDPRTVLTLPHWINAIGGRARLAIAYRHPTLVAQSLNDRDRIPLKQGYALWAEYNRRILDYSEQYSCAFLRFDTTPVNILAQLDTMCSTFNLPCNIKAVELWFDRTLIHSTTASSEGSSLSPEIRNLLERLEARN